MLAGTARRRAGNGKRRKPSGQSAKRHKTGDGRDGRDKPSEGPAHLPLRAAAPPTGVAAAVPDAGLEPAEPLRLPHRVHTGAAAVADGPAVPGGAVLGKGQMGSALMGSLQILCFCLQRDFWGTSVSLLLYSQKCQGVPFPPSCQNSLLLQRPH